MFLHGQDYPLGYILPAFFVDRNPIPMPDNESTTTTPELPIETLNGAMLNLPSDEFILGGRIFKIVDLPYDDYTMFVSLMAPVVTQIVNKMILSQNGGVELPGGITLDSATFTAFDFLTVCGKNLPEMACIVCKQTDPNITVEDVKLLAKKPMPLAEVVVKQIVRNGMIRDFTAFFQQAVAMMKSFR